MTARVGIGSNLIDHLRDLVDFAAVGGLPGAPLSAVYGTQVSLLIRPGIPDVNIVFPEVLDIGVPSQEPKEFVDHAFEKNFTGSDQREPIGEIKSQLSAEDAFGPGPGPVTTDGSSIQNLLQQAEVLVHINWSRQGNYAAAQVRSGEHAAARCRWS